MIVINIAEDDVKLFMNKLLKEDAFDKFEVRRVEIITFTKFEINGVLYKNFISTNEEDYDSLMENDYILWNQIKPFVFDIIKGFTKPSSMKYIFSCQEKHLHKIHENAKSLFLNVSFEDNVIKCVTGTSQKQFAIDKFVDNSWDEYVQKFLKHNEIPFIIDK